MLVVGLPAGHGRYRRGAGRNAATKKVDPAVADSLARANFREGQLALDTGNVQAAYMAFRTAVRHVPNFEAAHLATAELLENLQNYSRAYGQWANMTRLFPNNAHYEFSAGCAAFRSAKYAESQKHLEAFTKLSISPDSLHKAKDFIAMCCATKPELLQEGVQIPEVLDKGDRGVNTRLDEYYPVMKPEGYHLVYTRMVPKKGNRRPSRREDGQEDLFDSRRGRGGVWSAGKILSERLESSDNESAAHFTADGHTVLYTECDRHCRIMESHLGSDGRWSKPSAIQGTVNGSFDSKAAVLSPDGKKLYFSSNRPGGEGKFDIWVAHLAQNGRWDSVANMGPSVNTAEDELAPYLTTDGKRLFFSSNGRKGQGGLDLYAMDREGKDWGAPYNLGYPINTKSDEMSFCLSGDTAYFASNRDRMKGLDIYKVKYGSGRPLHSSYIQVKLIDSATKRQLPAAVSIVATEKGNTIADFHMGYQGTFTAYLATGKEFRISARQDGYFDKTLSFTPQDRHTRESPLRLTVPLRQIPKPKIKPQPAVSKGKDNPPSLVYVHFETGQYNLPKNIDNILKDWLAYLKRNSKVRIRITGHTDNTGEDNLNSELSVRRAESVKSYLVRKGIGANRLETEGRGAKEPLGSNNTEDGRAKNRRIECRVLR